MGFSFPGGEAWLCSPGLSNGCSEVWHSHQASRAQLIVHLCTSTPSMRIDGSALHVPCRIGTAAAAGDRVKGASCCLVQLQPPKQADAACRLVNTGS